MYFPLGPVLLSFWKVDLLRMCLCSKRLVCSLPALPKRTRARFCARLRKLLWVAAGGVRILLLLTINANNLAPFNVGHCSATMITKGLFVCTFFINAQSLFCSGRCVLFTGHSHMSYGSWDAQIPEKIRRSIWERLVFKPEWWRRERGWVLKPSLSGWPFWLRRQWNIHCLILCPRRATHWSETAGGTIVLCPGKGRE